MTFDRTAWRKAYVARPEIREEINRKQRERKHNRFGSLSMEELNEKRKKRGRALLPPPRKASEIPREEWFGGNVRVHRFSSCGYAYYPAHIVLTVHIGLHKSLMTKQTVTKTGDVLPVRWFLRETNSDDRSLYHIRRMFQVSFDEAVVLKKRKETEPCAICGIYSPGREIDHDHASGKIRGILCSPCNARVAWYEKRKDSILRYLGEQ